MNDFLFYFILFFNSLIDGRKGRYVKDKGERGIFRNSGYDGLIFLLAMGTFVNFPGFFFLVFNKTHVIHVK